MIVGFDSFEFNFSRCYLPSNVLTAEMLLSFCKNIKILILKIALYVMLCYVEYGIPMFRHS